MLKDADREILTIAGHNKGCLSIAYALDALTQGKDKKAITKSQKTRVIWHHLNTTIHMHFDFAKVLKAHES